MPKEKSIPKRLSGGEALDSLCHQIRQRLANHGHFHSHKAYIGYSATVKIEFRPAMSYAPPLTDDFIVETGDFVELAPAAQIEVEIPVKPPNLVRQEAGMPTPVQVEEGGMVVEKFVPQPKYKGKVKAGDGIPVTANTDVPAVAGKFEMPDGAVEQYGIQTRG